METPKFLELKYIKVSERDAILNQVELRKKIVHKLKELKRLTSTFKSHDLGSAAQLLRKTGNTRILDHIDKEMVTVRLMELHVLFTQPGMRYCQAQALVHALMKDTLFSSSSETEKKLATDKILEDVCGRLMEEIVLLETAKAISKSKRVFKLLLSRGEFDMVIYDSQTNSCELYEIKHSNKIVPEQYHVLLDPERCKEAERRFGSISKRCVLYCSEDYETNDGVIYLNVENYLKSL